MTNYSGLLGMVTVSALKVLHLRKPLSPWQVRRTSHCILRLLLLSLPGYLEFTKSHHGG